MMLQGRSQNLMQDLRNKHSAQKDQIWFWNYTYWMLVEKFHFGREHMVCEWWKTRILFLNPGLLQCNIFTKLLKQFGSCIERANLVRLRFKRPMPRCCLRLTDTVCCVHRFTWPYFQSKQHLCISVKFCLTVWNEFLISEYFLFYNLATYVCLNHVNIQSLQNNKK